MSTPRLQIRSAQPGRTIASLGVALALIAPACSSTGPASEQAPSAPRSAESNQRVDGLDNEAEGQPVAESIEPDEVDPNEDDPNEVDDTPTAAEPDTSDGATEPVHTSTQPEPTPAGFGEPPIVEAGALDPEVRAAVDTLLGDRLLDRIIDDQSFAAIRTIGASDDVRTAWWLTDLLRVTGGGGELSDAIVGAIVELTGARLDPFSPWGDAVDHLIAWDIPAPPDYLTYKQNPYLVVEPRWDVLFAEDADIDWRLVSWGGVAIDDRQYDTTDAPCNCIPASDNPETTDAAGGDRWLDDDTIVFGVIINDQARAYPRSIMEVREMVNDTLGGRDFAMPYCTLCGSAQVYLTDELPDGIERPIMRTSGLLIRSNKVMYDVGSKSIFDTFTGRAVSGPLRAAGIQLTQNSVVTTTWGRWKSDHPDTTVLAIGEALGRPTSDLRNTRDANGPIFPIGNVDPRLAVQDDVLGVFGANGEPIAFHVGAAHEALARGEPVRAQGIEVVLDGGGLRAVDSDGNDLASHQAFWFAWSQFHPDTLLWS